MTAPDARRMAAHCDLDACAIAADRLAERGERGKTEQDGGDDDRDR